MSEARLEAAARALASLEPDEDWPTNEALGGSLTGTRDDEYRDGMRMMAKDALDAADGVVSPIGYSTVTFIQGQLIGYTDCTPLILTLKEAEEEARTFNASAWNSPGEVHRVVEVRLFDAEEAK